MTFKKILTVASHPDDEILGCGGTIKKFTESGSEVCTVILGEGMLSRGDANANAVGKLQKHCKKANEIIGVKDLREFSFPDNAFDSVPLLNIVKVVEDTIDDFKPDVIFTHHGGDLNIDHRLTFQAVLTGCRPQGFKKSPEIYSFFIPSSTDWTDGYVLNHFMPTMYVDVSDQIESKIAALSEYKTEMREYPHSRSLESVRIISQYWGNRVGLHFAEPFTLIRRILY
ncbi:MAG: PIG-L deacetylase family protein [Methanoregula sp.]|nr:PIG-L deacetylase family protein [Methanoregula sp.]